MYLDSLCKKFERIVDQNCMLEDPCNQRCFFEDDGSFKKDNGDFSDFIKNPWFIGIVIGLLVAWILLMGCRSCA